MKTVYFLGAGASKGSDFGLPVMNKFFKEFDEEEFEILTGYLEKTFPGQSIEKLNLEEVITHMELSLEGFGAMWDVQEPELIGARRELDDYIRRLLDHAKLFGENPSRSYSDRNVCTAHKHVFEKLAREDSIITLNYDLVADLALLKVSQTSILSRSRDLIDKVSWSGLGASIQPGDRGSGFYLKLHGSLDWLYCPNPVCGNHEHFSKDRRKGRSSGIEPGDPCGLCGSGLVSVIIPPAMKKSFERFPRMGLIWNMAFRELKAADQWIFIGASFPESDYYLRWLLREACRNSQQPPEVEIVNPDPNVCDTMHRILGIRELKAYWKGLKEFVDATTSPTPKN